MKLTIKTADDLKIEAKAATLEAEKATARAYLTETDWMVVRRAETGEPIPPEVTEKREAARGVL